MTLSAQAIYLQKRAKVILSETGAHEDVLTLAHAATINRNLNAIGFTMDPELFQAISRLDTKVSEALYETILPILKEMTGAHRTHRPMYPNFPKQVMEASDVELYVNAILHYWGSYLHDVTGVPVRYLPEYAKDKREALPDAEIKLRVLRLGSQKDFNAIFTTLVGANAALSQSDKDIVSWFAATYEPEDIPELVPETIPQKENLAHLFAELAKVEPPQYLFKHLKTATDALRVAAVMSGGDVSLAKPVKFRKFKRIERRFFLSVIEKSVAATEDMLRRPEVFKRFGHALHAGDYAKQYPKAFAAFGVVRNDEKFATLNNQVERALKEKNLFAAVDLLSARPGDYSRRLDHLMRLSMDEHARVLRRPAPVLYQYGEIVDRVATPALLQAYGHFKNRDNGLGSRAFFPKGSVAKTKVVDEALPKLEEGMAREAAEIIRKALVRRFAKLPSLGRTYLDPSLKTQMVPFAVRSASKSLRTIARGSRMPLPDCSTLRFFIWWKDGKGRTDLDLSAVFLDADFNFKTTVAYYNLKELGCYHSGDITSAPKGAAEFIDVNIDLALKQGRYVVMVVNSYTLQPFKDLPECFAGWMGRTAVQSGEVFDARTVVDKIDVTADMRMALPVVFDLEKREAIWLDMTAQSVTWVNNVHRNKAGITQTVKAIATLPKPTLHDLFEMHIEARGQPSPREEAQTVFSLHEGITPFEQDRIMKEFLA